MDINQRGLSSTSNWNTILMDRWKVNVSWPPGGSTTEWSTDVPSNGPFKYSMKHSGTNGMDTYYYMESQDAVSLAGQTVTVSLYAKQTSGTGAFTLYVDNPTSAAEDYNTTTVVTGAPFTIASQISSTWQRYSYTFDMPSIAKNGARFIFRIANANTAFLTGFKIEVGNTATAFVRNGNTYSEELYKCQRYYFRILPGSGNFTYVGTGVGNNSLNRVIIPFMLPVPMRTTPTFGWSAPTVSDTVVGAGSTGATLSALYIGGSWANNQYGAISYASQNTITNGQAYTFLISNVNYIEFSSEVA